MSKLSLFASYPQNKFRGLLQRTEKLAQSPHFNIDEVIDLDHAGEYLDKVGIRRRHLEDTSLLQEHQQSLDIGPVTNNLVVDLELYRRNFSKQHADVTTWIAILGRRECKHETTSAKVKKTFEKYSSLKKTKTAKGIEALNSFMNTSFLPDSTTNNEPDSQVTSKTHTQGSVPHARVGSMVVQMKTMQGQLQSQDEVIKQLETKEKILKDELAVKEKEILTLKTSLAIKDQNCRELKKNLEMAKQNLEKANRKITSMKYQNYYSRLKKKERELDNDLQIILQHREGKCKAKTDSLRRKLKVSQTQMSYYKGKSEQQKENIKELKRRHRQDNLEIEDETHDPAVLHLKDEKGHFTPEARICIMRLVGEEEVSGSKCGAVMQTAARLCGVTIPDSELPSQRSALRFADQGQVIGKSHVAEVLTQAEQWDLHTDGTSRGGKTYIGQQATTASGTFSMGFVPVATEDTSTLVEVSIQMLEELSALHPSGDINFYHILLGLSGVMTDRAPVMKSFGRKLEEERKELLQTDEGLEFLHCNAHFLLGLGAESRKALATDEKEKGEALGRDAQPGFFNYNSDCSAYRYIWMACDCLGPRGDDKSGCRDSWEAYCMTVEKTSTVTSFRENRFNNLFQAAASLHFHRDDISEFLSNCLTKKNKKLESVLADCKSDIIDCHLIVLGLLYFRVTGPYWCLIGGSVHYLDFYMHVERLYTYLQAWKSDASSALDVDCPSVFTGVHFQHNEKILQSLLAISAEQRSRVKPLLEKVCASLVEVTERQLYDFLPGGKYHNVQDQQLRKKLDHSSLTNLISEQCFGDLDFSLFKRRHTSLHHHSTINILKRNKSISSWLVWKTPAEIQELLQFSAHHAQSLRKQHILMEKDTVRTKQTLLQQAREAKEASEEKKRQQKMTILQDLKPHNGPCSTAEEILNMLQLYQTNSNLKKAIKAEILFQKSILDKKSPLLKVTGSLLVLVNRVLEFFGGETLNELPSEPACPPEKRQRVDSSHSESDSDGEIEVNYEFETNFKFRLVDQYVAVYYYEGFYIGFVTEIIDDNNANVSFMSKAVGLVGRGVRDNTFKWPSPPVNEQVKACQVFASGFVIAPINLRFFKVEKPYDDLEARYQAFKKHLITQD